jgi:hypothetical protein
VSAVALLLAASRSAGATGVCDPLPLHHFCVQMDTTSATVCDLLHPGGLDDACDPSDVNLRDAVRRRPIPPLRALLVRFDDATFYFEVTRHEEAPELDQKDLAAHAREVRETTDRTGPVAAAFAPPVLSRVGGVQIVRFDRQWFQGAAGRMEEVDVEVRARDAMYTMSFQGRAGPRLVAFADAALATIDARPRLAATGAGDALAWIVRGALAAGAIAVLLIWLGRRKGRGPGIDARQLWPH